MPELEVRGNSNWWQVYQDGKTLPRIYSSRDLALAALKGVEKRWRRATAQRRACLCCGRPFASQGPHNRMCDHCRRMHR